MQSSEQARDSIKKIHLCINAKMHSVHTHKPVCTYRHRHKYRYGYSVQCCEWFWIHVSISIFGGSWILALAPRSASLLYSVCMRILCSSCVDDFRLMAGYSSLLATGFERLTQFSSREYMDKCVSPFLLYANRQRWKQKRQLWRRRQ